MLQTVMDRLQAAFENEGKAAQFNALKEFLALGRGERTYAQVAEDLGLSESGVKVAVHRMRKRYRDILYEEVLATVNSPEASSSRITP